MNKANAQHTPGHDAADIHAAERFIQDVDRGSIAGSLTDYDDLCRVTRLVQERLSPPYATAPEPLAALDALIGAFGEVDAILDAWASADPEGMTPSEKRRQRNACRARDKADAALRKAVPS